MKVMVEGRRGVLVPRFLIEGGRLGAAAGLLVVLVCLGFVSSCGVLSSASEEQLQSRPGRFYSSSAHQCTCVPPKSGQGTQQSAQVSGAETCSLVAPTGKAIDARLSSIGPFQARVAARWIYGFSDDEVRQIEKLYPGVSCQKDGISSATATQQAAQSSCTCNPKNQLLSTCFAAESKLGSLPQALQKSRLERGQSLKVDTRHLAAFEQAFGDNVQCTKDTSSGVIVNPNGPRLVVQRPPSGPSPIQKTSVSCSSVAAAKGPRLFARCTEPTTLTRTDAKAAWYGMSASQKESYHIKLQQGIARNQAWPVTYACQCQKSECGLSKLVAGESIFTDLYGAFYWEWSGWGYCKVYP